MNTTETQSLMDKLTEQEFSKLPKNSREAINDIRFLAYKVALKRFASIFDVDFYPHLQGSKIDKFKSGWSASKPFTKEELAERLVDKSIATSYDEALLQIQSYLPQVVRDTGVDSFTREIGIFRENRETFRLSFKSFKGATGLDLYLMECYRERSNY